MVVILHSISLLLELIFRDIHAILNSMENLKEGVIPKAVQK